MDAKKYWICFNCLGLSSVKMRKLLDYFGDPETMFGATQRQLKEAGVSEVKIELMSEVQNTVWEREIEKANSLGAAIVTLADENYPELLKEIPDPPPVLYVKGTICKQEALPIGIVGTRNPTAYGIRMAEKFAYELSCLGFSIISGLARGIDSYAHRGCLKAKGRTIAVLGSGFMNMYPRENESIAQKISERGCVISEFPLDTRPNRENFPRRNRIISGLSKGILVIEAGQRSGALITAHLAVDQNREVFSVPGQIGSLMSTGANQLLKEGAKLVETTQDILDEFGLEINKSQIETEKRSLPELNKAEKNVLSVLSGNKCHIEEILNKTGLPYVTLSQALTGLELKEIIESLPGKFYRKCC